ncbi:alpha-amylase family glycosyl hydrolase [Faecalicatena contorta]|uniref:alpha-amylase family glycosyl hydrolase n=1 Tax=Lachnospiraceae TaxID=186803 RepID=UPI001F1BA7C1|nr:alpha-amylase family glycosyl hydrolase [Faecalicatena contorta]MCF2667346.1 glycogen debranching protein [Faecalicatena contorta]
MKEIQGRPLPLGVTRIGNTMNFSVAVPQEKECQLLLYHAGEKKPCMSFGMKKSIGEVRYIALEDIDPSEYEYNYEMDGEIVVDPYVKALAGREKWGQARDVQMHEVRGKLDIKEYDWEGDAPLQLPYHSIIAYSLHVRGFTKHSSSKVKAKGTFRGVIEKIPYLKELGINQIQCMPVYDFEENLQYCNYWGYGDAYCFAPKGAYAYSKDAVNELKDMVKSCHREGIEVVLEMPFSGNVPKQMMEECLRYYMMEYHVDGFILNPSSAPMEGICADPILKKTKIMVHQTGFQTVMRRFLKSDEGMIPEVMYWLRHNSLGDRTYNYFTNQNGFTLYDLVSYDGKHNEANGENNQDGPEYNYSWNCGVEGVTRKKAVLELRQQQIKNAFFLLLFAQGTPCILAGDEFENTQKGNNNVYCQDNPVGWLDWSKLEKKKELHDFVKKLIEIRKAYPVFWPEEEMRGIDQVSCGVPDVSYHGESAWRVPSEVSSRQLGVYYSGAAVGGDDCFVAYNMHWQEHPFALPALSSGKKWYKIASTSEGVLEEPELLDNQRLVEVAERTIMLVIGRK